MLSRRGEGSSGVAGLHSASANEQDAAGGSAQAERGRLLGVVRRLEREQAEQQQYADRVVHELSIALRALETENSSLQAELRQGGRNAGADDEALKRLERQVQTLEFEKEELMRQVIGLRSPTAYAASAASEPQVLTLGAAGAGTPLDEEPEEGAQQAAAYDDDAPQSTSMEAVSADADEALPAEGLSDGTSEGSDVLEESASLRNNALAQPRLTAEILSAATSAQARNAADAMAHGGVAGAAARQGLIPQRFGLPPAGGSPPAWAAGSAPGNMPAWAAGNAPAWASTSFVAPEEVA